MGNGTDLGNVHFFVGGISVLLCVDVVAFAVEELAMCLHRPLHNISILHKSHSQVLTYIHSLHTLPHLQLPKELFHAPRNLVIPRHRLVNLTQQPPQLLTRIKARGKTAHKRRRLVPALCLPQQKHVLLYRLRQRPQRGFWISIYRHRRRKRLFRGIVEDTGARLVEAKVGRVASGEVVKHEVGVELADGGPAGACAAVDGGAVVGEEGPAEGDAGEVVGVYGDELLGGVCLQGWRESAGMRVRVKAWSGEDGPMVM